MRRAEPALHAGAYRRLDTPDGVLGYERSAGADRFVVLISFGDEPRRVPDVEGEVVIATDRSMDGTMVSGSVTLPPHGAALIRA